MKEMLVSLLGIAIAIVLAVLALGIANWAIDVFNITEELSRAASLVAVALIIGPAIKAFATKEILELKLKTPQSTFFCSCVINFLFCLIYFLENSFITLNISNQ